MLFLPHISWGQDGSTSYGVYASHITTSISNNRADRSSFRQGYNVGAFFEYRPISSFGLSVGGAYSTYGANQIERDFIYYPDEIILNPDGESAIGQLVRSDVSIVGVDVPVLTHFYLGDFFRISLGGNYTYMLSTSSLNTYELDVIPVRNITYSNDIDPRIDDHEFSVMGGFGVGVTAGNFTLNIDALYRYGLTDINNREVVTADPVILYSSGLYLSARLAFTIAQVTSLF